MSLRLFQLAGLMVAAMVLAFHTPASAFDRERPSLPEDGATVGNRLQFFIHAEGDWSRDEVYKIEVSDDGFQTVLHSFDGARDRKGWSVASLPGEPDEEFESDRGVYFFLAQTLPDGDYRWRAFKYDGTGYRPLGGEISFRVDTVHPAPVGGVRADMSSRGRLTLRWDPVFEDAGGGPEVVAGYRIYRFDNRRAFINRPAYLVGETTATRFELPSAATEGEPEMLFFRVVAVDAAGNEEGRPFPTRLGEP